MEGDVGGGLAIERNISLSEDNPKLFKIDSSLLARNVGAGSGGYSRLVGYLPFCHLFFLY